MSPTSPTEGEAHAAIDIGTNSIHLLVASVDDGGFEILTSDKESVRLGSGPGDLNEMTKAAIDRGVAALTRFRQIAESHGVSADKVAAVATSAVREADNGDVFIARARSEAGVEVDVISGLEEARLIHLGVLQALPLFERQHLVVDIGGGSTEMIVGRAAKVLAARSVKLGHLRLTNRFFPEGLVTEGAVVECRRYVRSFLAPAVRDLAPLGYQVAAGASGTITTLAVLESKLDRALGERSRPVDSLTRSGLSAVIADLTAYPTPVGRVAGLAGLEEKRADVIVGGALLLEAVFEAFDVNEMLVSPYALREGVLLDRAHLGGGGFLHLNDIRGDSVLRMAEAFEEDRAHVQHSTDLALQLFDDLRDHHGYGVFERDLLKAAGLLHNVGLFISHAAHHKHSYYVIRNSDRLSGFTEREVELIAQIARYHRRSGPKPTHQAYTSLTDTDQQRVLLLSGLLRVAIGLDRTRECVVQSVRADVRPGTDDTTATGPYTQIGCGIAAGADAALELYTAGERVGVLERALAMRVRFDTERVS